MEKKFWIILLAVVLSASTLAGFTLGVYSHLGNKQSPYDNRDFLIAIMDSLSYNAAILELFPEVNNWDGVVYSESCFSTLLNQLEYHSSEESSSLMDAYVTDRSWTSAYQYSSYSLSKSNYVRIEAEFSNEDIPLGFTQTDPEEPDDLYWYCNRVMRDELQDPMMLLTRGRARYGYSYWDDAAEHNSAWICNPDSTNAGYAYADLQSRWSVGADNYPLVNGLFWVQAPIGGHTDDDDCFYITYRIKLDDFQEGLSPDDPLLDFRPVGYCLEDGEWGDPIHIEPNQVTVQTLGDSTSLTDGVLRYSDYLAVDSPSDYFDVTAKVTYQKLIDSGLLSVSYNTTIPSLNPRLFWYGNCKLSLDYIDIEDSQYRLISEDNPTLSSQVAGRVADVKALGTNVKGLMTFDEPTQAQFSAYRLIQDKIDDPSTPTMAAVNRRGSVFEVSTDRTYNHYAVFKHQALPKIIMPDPYPIKGILNWSRTSVLETGHLQRELDSMVSDVYDWVGRECQADSLKFYPVVQAFGNWDGSKWRKEFIRPPKETQTMLQYLPLCFGADGIFNYRLYGKHDESNKGDYCALGATCNSSNSHVFTNLEIDHDTYDALRECNPRVRRYGEILNQVGVNWDMSGTLLDTGIVAVNPDYQPNLSEYLLDSIQLAAETSPNYKGYIQLGFYEEGVDSNYIMLVNRRSNYFVSSPIPDYPRSYSSADLVPPDDNFRYFFPGFPSQTVVFDPNTDSHTSFGTHIALYDPYDNSIYQAQNDEISIEIGPGDGILLKMCSSLPSLVTNDAVLKRIAFLEGNIAIEDSAFVSISPDCTTIVKPGTSITVRNGASLSVMGTMHIGSDVTISIEEGASINFDGATCSWGSGSELLVSGGSLDIDGGAWSKADSAESWSGIRASDSSFVTISNTEISYADYHQVNNSTLLVNNSVFNIPINSWGFMLNNTNSGYHTEIVNTIPECGFYGASNMSSKGIYLSLMQNPVYISNVDFANLYHGVFKSSPPKASDTYSECRFVNCGTGIYLCNNENATDIQQCSFANSQSGEQGIGIRLVASSPTISTCNFTNLYRGLTTEFALISGLGMQSRISESNFFSCNTGIESRSSNHYLKANNFNQNKSGIVNHAGSNLNLSYGANNVLLNQAENIVFWDTMPYESTIQLFTGHNDFHHLLDTSTGLSAIDFCFDANYYNFLGTMNFQIDASNNWFEDNQVAINDTAYIDYVFVDYYDPSPSMPAPPPESDRLFIALDYEAQGLYESAGTVFKAIIEDQLEEEETYVTSAIDGLYRCTWMIPEPSWDLTDYFDAKAIQYAIDYPSLSAILKDYLTKVFVLNKDFQSAVDLIQIRIDNPISEIDSLRAVLDLEIVLQLAAMEEDKRPLITKYTQYQYPDSPVFSSMHNQTWERYISLFDKNDTENTPYVAAVPQIHGNYPNPFNPSTTIAFSIPETGRVRMTVYNIRGQKVKDLFDSELVRGHHKLVWDGRDNTNRSVGSGLYFFKLESGSKTSVLKAMLMK